MGGYCEIMLTPEIGNFNSKPKVAKHHYIRRTFSDYMLDQPRAILLYM